MPNEKDEPGLHAVAKRLGETPIAPAHGIAAIALEMAMKYHDIQMIKDGALYQQYKLEGKNFQTIHLDMVFDTAMKIEEHLLGASERIAKIVVDAIEFVTDEDKDKETVDSDTPTSSEMPNV